MSVGFRFICLEYSNLETKFYNVPHFFSYMGVLPQGPHIMWYTEHETDKGNDRYFHPGALLFGPLYSFIIYTCLCPRLHLH